MKAINTMYRARSIYPGFVIGWPIRVVSRSLMFLFASGVLSAQPQLQITSPSNRTVVNPGQSLNVTVSATGGTFASVMVVAQNPIPSTEPLASPPYQFKVEIPTFIKPGSYQLTADGYTSPGQGTQSASIIIVVEPPLTTRPSRLRVEPESLNLAVGQKGYLSVVVEFDDGKTVSLGKSAFVDYRSDNSSVASSQKEGIVQAIKSGSATIVIRYRNVEARVPVTVRDRRP